MMRFTMCEEDCSHKNGMASFLSQGYYPSSPKWPQFAFAIDIFQFFHLIHMKGPSSKQGFCLALQIFVESRKSSHENEYEANLVAYVANCRFRETCTTTSLEYTQPG